jgi:hypothetical protein
LLFILSVLDFILYFIPFHLDLNPKNGRKIFIYISFVGSG